MYGLCGCFDLNTHKYAFILLHKCVCLSFVYKLIASGYASFHQVQNLKRELNSAKKSRKVASALLRLALQKAAQQMMEKAKNKSLSHAMKISMQINKIVWSMLIDGKCIAEAEINDLVSS